MSTVFAYGGDGVSTCTGEVILFEVILFNEEALC
jgi:hypothetical protein